MTKEVSIIIPHYNSLQWLKRLLNTIPYKEELQVIVVDDKSEWEAGEWETLKLTYPRVEFYKNETSDKGAGVCRNIALSKAVGKWLLFADADDYFTENFYSYIKEYFETENDIVYFMPTSIYEETGEPATRHIYMAERIKRFLLMPSHKNELILRYEYEGPCSRLIRRSVVVENHIEFEKVKYSNDVMFSAKVARMAAKIAADKRIIYVITKSRDSLTSTINPESAKIRLDVFVRKTEYLRRELSKEDFKILNINGMGWFLYVLKNKLGWKMFFYCVRSFRESGVRLFNYRMFIISYWREKWFDMKLLRSSM